MTDERESDQHTTDELDQLRARVAELEAKDEALGQGPAVAGAASSRAGARLRSVLAAMAIVVGVVLAPVAALGTWAHVQLVDTNRFVQTFAPLADSPEMQALVVDQVTTAIDENVDIEGLVSDLMAGLTQLDLPPRAAAAAQLLEGPAVAGVRSTIRSAVERVVASPQFAAVWEAALRESHARAIALLQGEGTVLTLSDDGVLALQLGPVIEQVKSSLIAQGLTFAEFIPEIDRAVPIVASDSLALVRTLYAVSTAVGYWLPWVVVALLAAGVALARNRPRALAWAGAGYAASMLLLSLGLGIGRQFFVATVSPSIMPAATARVLFEQITELMSATVTAMAVLALLIAVGAWLSGSSRPATAIRGAGESGLVAVRAAADRHGLDPRGVGRVVERWRSAIVVVTVALGVFLVFQNRPASLGSVLGALAGVVVVLLVVELVRRPAPTPAPRPGE